MKKLIKIAKNEDGQAIVLAALLMVVLMGFAAFAVDIGNVALAKAKLQNAADAAALAGAQDLGTANDPADTAKNYAEMNGVEESETTVTAPYNSDSTKIKVECTRTIFHTFAQVLGFTQTDVSAYAIAKKNSHWAGEALPFINLDDDYTDADYANAPNPQIESWEKTTSGDFESIHPYDYEVINSLESDAYFKVHYSDGITLKKGVVANGPEKLKDNLEIYYQNHENETVYVFSLQSNIINDTANQGKVMLADGTYKYLYGSGDDKLKEGDVIDLSQMVLLECTFDNYADNTLTLTVNCVYDIWNGIVPTNFVIPEAASSRLVD